MQSPPSSAPRRLGSTSCAISGNIYLRSPAGRATVGERCFFGCLICTPSEGCDLEVTSLLPAHAVSSIRLDPIPCQRQLVAAALQNRGRRPGAEPIRLIHPGRAAARGYTCATSSLPLLRPTTTDLRNLPGGSAATRLPAHRSPGQGTCHFRWSKRNPGADTTPPALMSSRCRRCEFSPDRQARSPPASQSPPYRSG